MNAGGRRRALWIVLGVAVVLIAGCAVVTWTPGSDGPGGEGGVTQSRPVLAPAMLEGAGEDIDGVAFWHGSASEDTLLFVTAQANSLVEVWQFPFTDRELDPLRFTDGLTINGVAVDQQADRLYVTSGVEGSGDFQVEVFALPSLERLFSFGSGIVGEGETGLAIMHRPDGATWVYVSEDFAIHIFEIDDRTATKLGDFSIPTGTIESIVADSHTQLVYVPEEKGADDSVRGVYVFDAEGRPAPVDGTNRFGDTGIFQEDEEGAALYRCFDASGVDTGRGVFAVSDQRDPLNEFEFFDRETRAHLGTVSVEDVNGTDGITITEVDLPGYPDGILAAVDEDAAVALISWTTIADSLGYRCS